MVVWNTDNLEISYFLGPGSVTAYAITFKLFSTAFSIFVLANSVLMPMFGNAVGKSEWTWLSQTYENALSIMIVFGGLVWVGGLVFAKPVILLWTGLSGYGGELVVFAMGGYGYVLSAVNLHANLLSGMNATRSMLWIGIAEAIVNFYVIGHIDSLVGYWRSGFRYFSVSPFYCLLAVAQRHSQANGVKGESMLVANYSAFWVGGVAGDWRGIFY